MERGAGLSTRWRRLEAALVAAAFFDEKTMARFSDRKVALRLIVLGFTQ